MNKLSQLRVKNYLKHEDITLDFCKDVNIIAGASDQGKSSLLRAIEWLVKNKKGFDFRYDPLIAGDKKRKIKKEDLTEVDLVFDDEEVKRIRNEKGINQYVIGKKKFEDLREIPSEIRSLINIEDFCFQSQHDPYFLLQDSPGEVAKKLNKVSGLDLIDKSLKNINSMESITSREVKNSKEIIKTKEAELRELDFLEDAEPLIVEIKEEIEDFKEVKNQLGFLNNIIISSNEIQEKLDLVKSWLDIEVEYNSLSMLISEFSKKEKEKKRLDENIRKIEEVNESLKDIENWLLVDEESEALFLLIDKRGDVYYEFEKINKTIVAIEDLNNNISDSTRNLESLMEKYNSKLSEAKVCPTCGQKIKRKNK